MEVTNTAASVFLVEALLFTAVCTTGISSVASATSGFSGASRWVLFIQGLSLALTATIVIIARRVGPRNGRKLASIAGNAYCSMAFLAFTYYLVFSLKGVWLVSLLSSTPESLVISSSSKSVYRTSERLNWAQAATGNGGWVSNGLPDDKGVQKYMASDTSLPITGQICVGVVLGYLGISLLISMYLSHSLGESRGTISPLFMDARCLNAANSFIAIGMPGIVRTSFSECTSSPASSEYFPLVLVMIFLSLADDIIAWGLFRVISLCSAKRNIISSYYDRFYASGGRVQSIVVTLVSLVPYLVIISKASSNDGDFAGPVIIFSSTALSLLSITIVWVVTPASSKMAAYNINNNTNKSEGVSNNIGNNSQNTDPVLLPVQQQRRKLPNPSTSLFTLQSPSASTFQKLGRHMA